MSNSARHQVKIGENTFAILRYDGFTSVEILGDLQKQFTEPLLSMLDGKKSESEAEQAAAFARAATKLSQSLDGKTLRAWAERLLDPECVAVSINGDAAIKLDSNAVLRCGISGVGLIELCLEVIKYNYAEVLARVKNPTGLLAKLAATVQAGVK